ncbi:nucleoside triphosphate pyrophosphohydrolase family protein [Nocardia phage P3.1]|nr:nucleoside triphosphate pyrophosphohydrolase family protein [Nocardia phage P3.1]
MGRQVSGGFEMQRRYQEPLGIPTEPIFGFLEYQERAVDTAVYPCQGGLIGMLYVALGLGEVGEVQGKIKKLLRDSGIMDGDYDTMGGNYPIEFRSSVAKELGDVLWYVAQMCNELGLEMSVVAESNLAKLADRKERGVLKGSGDNR